MVCIDCCKAEHLDMPQYVIRVIRAGCMVLIFGEHSEAREVADGIFAQCGGNERLVQHEVPSSHPPTDAP